MSRRLCVSALIAAACGSASAQVSFYDLYYYGYTRQYDETPPGPADQYYFASRIFCSVPGEIVEATLYPPEPMFPVAFDSEEGTVWAFYSTFFPTRESLFAAYPTGEYLFEIGGGTLGEQVAVIDRQVDLFIPEPPAFTDGTFGALQGIDPSQEVTINFTPFDVPSGGNVALTYVSVYTILGGEFVYGDVALQPATMMVIPAGTLPPDSALAFYVTHSARLQYADGSFGDAEAVIAFDLNTYVEGFTTSGEPPCPADFNQDGGVDGADVDAFLAAWEAGEPVADVNQDGGVDGADVDTFFAAWEAGGCG